MKRFRGSLDLGRLCQVYHGDVTDDRYQWLLDEWVEDTQTREAKKPSRKKARNWAIKGSRQSPINVGL